LDKEAYDNRLSAIIGDGSTAYGSQNPADWQDAYGKLVKLRDELDGLQDEGMDDGPPPDASMVQMALARELSQLEATTHELGRHQELAGQLRDLTERLMRIDPRAADAMIRLRDWYLRHFKDVETRLKVPGGSCGRLGITGD
jgi:hypothetical protein